jgi:uncharacterized RDD family membrane protein YckC
MRWRDAKKKSVKSNSNFEEEKVIYGEFLARLFAIVMDMFMLILPINILVGLIFGFEALKNNDEVAGIAQLSLIVISTIAFWAKTGQTPGKKAFNLKVVDKNSLETASLFKLIVRYFAYFVSMISIIGFFIMFFRKDKANLHDIISGTVVIRFPEE